MYIVYDYKNIRNFITSNVVSAWSERCKQILKKWRALPNDKRAPYLAQARDNRAAVRIKKTQPVRKLRANDKYRQRQYDNRHFFVSQFFISKSIFFKLI